MGGGVKIDGGKEGGWGMQVAIVDKACSVVSLIAASIYESAR